MKNFQPGGLRNRKPDLGGRPKSDVNSYAPKQRYADQKPRFDNKERKDVQLFKATCTTCGNACEVPFRPDGTKPVLCRDCFATKNASPTNSATNRDRFTPNELRGRESSSSYGKSANESGVSKADYERLVKQINGLETKLIKILDLLNPPLPAKTKAKVVEDATEVEVEEAQAKVRKPKKVAAKKVVKKVAKKKGK